MVRLKSYLCALGKTHMFRLILSLRKDQVCIVGVEALVIDIP